MSPLSRRSEEDAAPLVQATGLTATHGEGRFLFRDLCLSLSREHVALIGRNGVGKSTLLELLSGETPLERGEVVLRARTILVRQSLAEVVDREDFAAEIRLLEGLCSSPDELARELRACGLPPWERLKAARRLSHGELRKLRLLTAKLSRPGLLLLDEPTQDLDEAGIDWLRDWLADWDGGLLAASHEPRLLEGFGHFFLLSESGGRSFSGSYAAMLAESSREQAASQARYARSLHRLLELEEHTIHIARRRARKRQYGRVSELGRATPRMRLNQKRDYAQVKHGRMKRIRDARIAAAREWTKGIRRALRVDIRLLLRAPHLPPPDGRPLVRLDQVSAVAEGRTLFQGLDLSVERQRLALTGPNGSGKTTLLKIMTGRRLPDAGMAYMDHPRIGVIDQGGSDWMLEDSLASTLIGKGAVTSSRELAELLVGHGFPPALARRPMSSLSPGERVRAALIVLFLRSPAPELLVLDEPTYCLDLSGRKSVIDALGAWEGGLVTASHDRPFLESIGIEATLKLDGRAVTLCEEAKE